MKSRIWVGTVLITLLVLIVLSAAGYALYRYGYVRGSMVASSGEGFIFHQMPFGRGHMDGFPGGGFGRPDLGEMPERMHDRMGGYGSFQHAHPFHDGFSSRMGAGWHPFFGLFSPFLFLLKVVFLGLILWLIYKFVTLFTGGKSWQLSFSSTEGDEPKVEQKTSGRAKKS